MISLNLFKVLAAALRKWASGPTEDVWESWVIRRLSDRRMSPSLTVVFDGLNERPSAQWQELLQQAIAKAPKIQVIVTTRPRFAETRLAYSGPPSSANEGWCLQGQPHGIQVNPFDDSELASALSQAGVEDYELPNSVLDLIRVPRYFRIAFEHLGTVRDYGSEITVERLLFHDFRNRVSLGRFSLVRSMPDYKWQEALERLTVEKRDQIHRPEGGLRRILREREIEDILSEDNRLDADDIETCLSEITEGKLFKNLGRGRYEAEPRLVQYALGALLFEEVVEKLEFGWSAAEQRLAEFCDPLAGLDFLASIVGTAAAIALLSADKCPEQAKTLLLVTWADIQNADITALFAAYARTAPKTYLEVAELLDSRSALRGQSGDFILDALLRLRDVPEFQHSLMEHFLSWIGWDKRIFTYGLSKATTFESIRSTFGLDIPDRTANQSGELRRIAMTVIGSGPQLPWLNVFLASCFTAVSQRKMGSLSDVTWIVRLNRHDPIEAHTAIRLIAQKLSKIPGALCNAVGCVLLAIVGGSTDQNRISSHYRNELRSLNVTGATQLIGAVSGETKIDEALGWIDPTAEFPRVRASAINEIVTFGDFVRSARESPAAISRIQPFIVKFLDSYLRSDSERITFPQVLNWHLPAIVTAPLVQTNIKEIELKLDELAQRLNSLGISYTTIDRLQYFVELVFGLSSASKRKQLRSSWAQFDLDRIAADENWGRLARGFAADAEPENSPDTRKRAGALKDFKFDTIVATGDQQMAAGHIAEYLNNWDHMTSRSRSVLLAALNSNVQSVDLKALAEKWSWVDSVAKEEQVYGALLLARDQTLSIETLTTHLPPIFWATAAMAREHTDENLVQWKRAFDSWITKSETNPIFDVATSLTLRTLESRGDRRKTSDVVGHNLQFLSILSEGKGRGLGGWIKTMREQPKRARGEFVRFMHCMLIRSLMSFDLKLARSLWRSFFDSGQEQLAPMRHSRDLIHSLTSSIPLLEDEWLQSALDLYDNDLSLFELALNCSADARKRDWLTGVIARDRSSSVDWRMARGNVLAGFALVDVGRKFIGKAKGGWAETTAAMAEVWHLRNQYSAVWYGRYLREPGTIKAVANLALHLASVDARARIWREKEEEGAFENRLQHAILYAHSISEFETDNTRRLQETYLGWPRSDAG
ncbi:hypothetical protein [Bradyrhizobium sp. CCBAU 51765]|uniref:hypothetical protein n=1 Tax=Bradyrhizobium sp. CCBAU 51765 TaxID=1325102 RepID=UPI001888EA90|nr:hypothetical protein [Bradyrhizobium sp. CCBAU 51765]